MVFSFTKTDKITQNLCILYFQTSVQVPAPAAGVIEELLVPDGGKVEGGTPLFKLRKGGVLSLTSVIIFITEVNKLLSFYMLVSV